MTFISKFLSVHRYSGHIERHSDILKPHMVYFITETSSLRKGVDV